MKKFLFVLILSLALISIAAAQPGRDVAWTQVDSALYPFDRAGSGVLGNYFYCFGGNPSNPAQALNLTTERWEESTPAPLGWMCFAAVATNDAIYLICRYPYSNEVQKFTPIGGGPTGEWREVAPYPLAECGIAAAWDGGDLIYAAGGESPGLVNGYKYHISTDTWTPIPDAPLALWFGGGAFACGKFYVLNCAYAGGAFLEYNPDNDVWTVKTSPPVSALPCFNTTFNDSLVFVVGGSGASIGNLVRVYNPMTDTWTLETPLPAIIANNSARFVPPDKVISASGYVWGGQTKATFCGTGFPSGSPSSHLTATLVPFVQPIQIPASGGTFDFYAFVNNSATFSQEVEIWTKVIAPGGSIIGPILGPATVDMDPGTSGWFRHQNVPGRWAAGLYTYIAYVGDYPTGNLWATDSLQFTKLTTGDGLWVGDWNCTGEEISPNAGAHGVHPSGSGPEGGLRSATPTMEVLPNPFNPTTVLSYQLPVASHVNLRIYDMAGRLVVDLVNGWRDAGSQQITFDGSGLPSGIYFAKLEAGDYSQVQKLVLLK